MSKDTKKEDTSHITQQDARLYRFALLLERVVLSSVPGGSEELSIEDQSALIKLQTLANILNPLYSTATGRGAEDVAKGGSICSEAMLLFLRNERLFVKEILGPLQDISQDDLMDGFSFRSLIPAALTLDITTALGGDNNLQGDTELP